MLKKISLYLFYLLLVLLLSSCSKKEYSIEDIISERSDDEINIIKRLNYINGIKGLLYSESNGEYLNMVYYKDDKDSNVEILNDLGWTGVKSDTFECYFDEYSEGENNYKTFFGVINDENIDKILLVNSLDLKKVGSLINFDNKTYFLCQVIEQNLDVSVNYKITGFIEGREIYTYDFDFN